MGLLRSFSSSALCTFVAAGCQSASGKVSFLPDTGGPISLDSGPASDAAGSDEGSAEAADSGSGDANSPGPSLARVPGWSVRKRLRGTDGADVVLEEVLAGLADAPRSQRLRLLSADGSTVHSWTAPLGSMLSDFSRHPSGAYSAILIAPDRSVSLERLSPDLDVLGTLYVHDPLIAGDPHVSDAGALDLVASGFAPDAARIASVDEDVIAVVETSWNSIVAYRASFPDGQWTEPARTLVEPPAAVTPFLPIGGSFDTFGAIVAWFRPSLDVDETGNAYVATWADPHRIAAHVDAFHDGLVPIPGGEVVAFPAESDVVVSKLDRNGARVWSRVVGTVYEDEPYALRARAGAVAVVGRSRRFPGFDNTTWDPVLSVISYAGEVVGSQTLPANDSGIFLAVDASPSGGWVLGGSDGWSQNPDGLSVWSFGTKLLAVLPSFDGTLVRVPLLEGPRHNEVRTVIASSNRVWFGGHEDGPIMHTGDSDPTLIVATGIFGVADVPSP